MPLVRIFLSGQVEDFFPFAAQALVASGRGEYVVPKVTAPEINEPLAISSVSEQQSNLSECRIECAGNFPSIVEKAARTSKVVFRRAKKG